MNDYTIIGINTFTSKKGVVCHFLWLGKRIENGYSVDNFFLEDEEWEYFQNKKANTVIKAKIKYEDTKSGKKAVLCSYSDK